MINIVGKRGWYFLFSALVILPALISLILPPGGWSTLDSGLKPGIDFTSGSVMDITFTARVSQTEIQDRMEMLGHPEALIQSTGPKSVLIRTKRLAESTGGTRPERQLIQSDLGKQIAPIESANFDSISPIIARETVRNTFFALIVASVFILFFIWYAFRRAPKAYRYGISAIIALVHDTVIVLGVFSILGRFLSIEVNTTFIIGILTVAGYSVNDTIVVFDRIRENIIRHPDQAFDRLVNTSIIETIGRSLNTSFTTFLVVLAMLLIGGPSIRGLLLVVAIGIIVGTYSSIFVASQFLVMWDKGEFGKVFRLGRRTQNAVTTGLLALIPR